MRLLRTRVAWLAALTLTLQLGVIAAASAALCCSRPNSATGADMSCCTQGGSGHACPIKKKTKSGAPALKSCCDLAQQALAALFGAIGVLETPYSSLPVTCASQTASTLDERPLASPVSPESPPPRS